MVVQGHPDGNKATMQPLTHSYLPLVGSGGKNTTKVLRVETKGGFTHQLQSQAKDRLNLGEKITLI